MHGKSFDFEDGRNIANTVILKNLTKQYEGGDVIAVDTLNLEVQPREFLTLLGPSGSGKTTTLMLVAGFVKPDKGRIMIGGEDASLKPSYKRNIGMVFQHYALFPHMSVFENISFPLKMRKVPKQEIHHLVESALELVQLPNYGRRMPNELSGGQQQRVALARALVFEPSVLLMDEPLGALDKKLREQMELELKRMHEKLGITVIYVTHDQKEALTMSTRIALMNSGKLIQVGSPKELYETPSTSFVADFIGESNLLKGRVKNVVDQSCIVVLDEGIEVTARYPGKHKIGQSVNLHIRPEKIQLTADEMDVDNSIEGKLEEIIYLGDITRYNVRIGKQTLLTVKRQNYEGMPNLKKGDRVSVGWKTPVCKVF